MVASRLVKIEFLLDPHEWHGNASERLWAEPLGNDRFRLRNSPFFAFGVSNEDVVLGREVEGHFRFVSVVAHSGHSTYRLRLQNRDLTSRTFATAWQALQTMGCSFEEGEVLAVDVPSRVDIYEVYALLEAGEAAGVWAFEEGHCGHPLRRPN